MATLMQQRCFNHALREAAVRCPECGNFFCRECVTEHDDRVICAGCLPKMLEAPRARRRVFAGLLQLAQGAFGVLVVWFFFFLIGHGLLSLPDSFHEGTVWKSRWIDKQ
jgi:hypothetical protein